MDTAPPALDILSRLTVAELLTRLDQIEAERKAILPLLRSLRARERAERLSAEQRKQREEAAHA